MSEERFYPRGYIGTFEAILLLARLHWPARWEISGMTPKEQAVWASMNKTRNGLLIWNILGAETRWSSNETVLRWSDFWECRKKLQKMLYDGDCLAKFIGPGGTIHAIEPKSWGDPTLDIDVILLTGTTDSPDGWPYTVLISEAEIEKHCRHLAAEKANATIPPSLAEIRRKYQDFLASLPDGCIPSYSQVERHLKSWNPNVRRDHARMLRMESHPNVKPGRRSKMN